uniref:RNA-binding protein MEX3D n=1 Tax=Zeugodacus cucurbitae TaxID=28588 RepID=A0A0A1XH31_ZEUCU
MEATASNLALLSPTVNVCPSNMLSIEATSASSTATMMSAPISTNINLLSAPSRGSSHLVFNSLVSVDRSQQQNHHKFHVGDQRALQLALEITAVGVNDTATIQPNLHSMNIRKKNNNLSSQQQIGNQQVIADLQQKQPNQKVDISANKSIQPTVSAASNGFSENNINGLISNNGSRNSSISFNNFSMPTPLLPTTIEDRSKKSQNMTECVPVPSSEHVAEIVGRQGR